MIQSVQTKAPMKFNGTLVNYFSMDFVFREPNPKWSISSCSFPFFFWQRSVKYLLCIKKNIHRLGETQHSTSIYICVWVCVSRIPANNTKISKQISWDVCRQYAFAISSMLHGTYDKRTWIKRIKKSPLVITLPFFFRPFLTIQSLFLSIFGFRFSEPFA